MEIKENIINSLAEINAELESTVLNQKCRIRELEKIIRELESKINKD